jgi:hypothetical protein
LFQSEKIFYVKKPVHPTYRIGRIDEGWLDPAEGLEHLTANSKVATVLGSIPASSDIVESKGVADAVVLNEYI